MAWAILERPDVREQLLRQGTEARPNAPDLRAISVPVPTICQCEYHVRSVTRNQKWLHSHSGPALG